MKWTIVLLSTSAALVKAAHHHGHHGHKHHHHHPPVTTTVTRRCDACTTATQVATLYIPDPTTETVVQVCTTTVVDEVTSTKCIQQTETETVYVPTTVSAACKGNSCDPKPTAACQGSSCGCKGSGCSDPQPAAEPPSHGHSHKHHHHHHHHHKCHHGSEKYTVSSGDCCWKVAQSHGITLAELREENSWLSAQCDLTPGETLCLPSESHHHHGHHHLSERDVSVTETAEAETISDDDKEENTLDAAMMTDGQDGYQPGMQKVKMSSATRSGVSALAAVGLGVAGLLLA